MKRLGHLWASDPEVWSELCHHLKCHLEQPPAPSWASVSPCTLKSSGFQALLPGASDVTKQLPAVCSRFSRESSDGRVERGPGRRHFSSSSRQRCGRTFLGREERGVKEGQWCPDPGSVERPGSGSLTEREERLVPPRGARAAWALVSPAPGGHSVGPLVVILWTCVFPATGAFPVRSLARKVCFCLPRGRWVWVCKGVGTERATSPGCHLLAV